MISNITHRGEEQPELKPSEPPLLAAAIVDGVVLHATALFVSRVFLGIGGDYPGQTPKSPHIQNECLFLVYWTDFIPTFPHKSPNPSSFFLNPLGDSKHYPYLVDWIPIP